MEDCTDCIRSFYNSEFRKRYCLAKKKIIADNSEAKKCERFLAMNIASSAGSM